jgi:hypothetical protein
MSLELVVSSSQRPKEARRLAGSTVMVGSLPSNQVALGEPGVEPIHCMLERLDDGRWRVTDLGALAGVKVNGIPVDVEAIIVVGDVLQIGTARIAVQEIAEQEPQLAAAAGAEPPPSRGQRRKTQPAQRRDAAAVSRLFYHPSRDASRGRLLEVVAYWGDTVLNVDHFHPGLKGFDAVTIGDPTKAHFMTGGAGVFETKVLADVQDEACVLRLEPGMAAHVRQGGQLQKVEGQRKMTLRPRDYAHVEFGAVRYFIHYANQPQVELPPNTARDAVFATLSGIATLAYVVLVALAIVTKPAPIKAQPDDDPWYVKYQPEQDVREPQIQHVKDQQIVTVQPKAKPPRPVDVAQPTTAVQPERPPVQHKPETPKQIVAQSLQPQPVKQETPRTRTAKQIGPVAAVAAGHPSATPQPTQRPAATPGTQGTSGKQAAGGKAAPAGQGRPSFNLANAGGPGANARMPSPRPGTQKRDNPGVESGALDTPATVNLKNLRLGLAPTTNMPGGQFVPMRPNGSGLGGSMGSKLDGHGLGGPGTATSLDVPGLGKGVAGWGVGPGGKGTGGHGIGGTGTDLANAFLGNGRKGGGGQPGDGGHSQASVSLPPVDPVKSGGLTSQEIMTVIRQNLNQIRHCYEQLLQRSPNAAGRLKVNFVVGPAGRVSTSRLVEASIKDAPFQGCVLGKINRWAFPAPRGGQPVEVFYPFEFSPL